MAMLEEAMMKIDTLPDRPAFMIPYGRYQSCAQAGAIRQRRQS
jgi:hypothetical protein